MASGIDWVSPKPTESVARPQIYRPGRTPPRTEEEPGWANPLKEFGKGTAAGVDQLQALGGGLTAMAGDVIGSDKLWDWGLEVYDRNLQEAEQNKARVGSYKDVGGVGEAIDYAAHGVGTLVPMIVPSLLTGGVGGILARRIATRGVSSFMERQVARGVAKGLTEAQAKAAALGRATTLGQGLGALTSSTGLQTGSIYPEILDETGEKRPGTALTFGVLTGALDAYPAFRVLSKFGLEDDMINKVAKSLTRDIVEQMGAEGGTELLQTVLERAAVATVDENYEVLSTEGREEIINATLLGGIGGGVIGGGANLLTRGRNRNLNQREPELSFTDDLRAVQENARAEVRARGGDLLEQENAAAAAALQRARDITDEEQNLSRKVDLELRLREAFEYHSRLLARSTELAAEDLSAVTSGIQALQSGLATDIGATDPTAKVAELDTLRGQETALAGEVQQRTQADAVRAAYAPLVGKETMASPIDGKPDEDARIAKLSSRIPGATYTVQRSDTGKGSVHSVAITNPETGGVTTFSGRIPQQVMKNLRQYQSSQKPADKAPQPAGAESAGTIAAPPVETPVSAAPMPSVDVTKSPMPGTPAVAPPDPDDIRRLSQASGDELAGMDVGDLHAKARDYNNRVEDEFIRTNLTPAEYDVYKALPKSRPGQYGKRDEWVENTLNADQYTQLQSQYADESRLEQLRNYVGQFDDTSPEAMGRSISLWFKDVDRSDFKQTPEYAGITSALRHAQARGWDLGKVLEGAKSRSEEWAGRDAAELFPRFFKTPEKKPDKARAPSAPVTSAPASIDAAANQAATSPVNDLPEPTEAQKEAGNYRKGHVKVQGLDITIENPKGSTRTGTDTKGRSWTVDMKHHYGYVKRTEGADGEQVDVFVGSDSTSDKVFVVNQYRPDGSFDEHKALVSFKDKGSASRAYAANYSDGRAPPPVVEMSLSEFKQWLKTGDTKVPVFSRDEGPKSAGPKNGSGLMLSEVEFADAVKEQNTPLFADAVSRFKSAADLMKWISQRSLDPYTRVLAARLVPLADWPLIGVRTRGVSEAIRTGMLPNDRRIYSARGFVWTQQGVHRMGLLEQNGGFREQTAVHEALHLATKELIRAKGGKTENGRAAYRRLLHIQNHLRKQLRLDADAGTLSLRMLGLTKEILKEHETITWGLSDSEVRAYMMTVKMPGENKTLWTAFVEALLKFLGASPNEHSMFSDLLAVTDQIITEVDIQQDSKTRTRAEMGSTGGGWISEGWPGVGDPGDSFLGEEESPKRPYGTAPDSLMGYSKYPERTKGWDDQNYKHEIIVRVTFPPEGSEQDAQVFTDAMRGLNTPHALERARRNWEGAEIEVLDSGPRGLSDNQKWKKVFDEEYQARRDVHTSKEAPVSDQTQTPAFQRWFGDSKVVDKKGKPLVVYRGTPSDSESGHFYTDKPEIAEGYTRPRNGWLSPRITGAIFPVYLSLQNPLIIDAKGYSYRNLPVPWQAYKPHVFGHMPENAVSVEKASTWAAEHGYDGLIVKNVKDSAYTKDATVSTVYVTQLSTQAKSAIGNRGTFDPDDPRILYEDITVAEDEPGNRLKKGGADANRIDSNPTSAKSVFNKASAVITSQKARDTFSAREAINKILKGKLKDSAINGVLKSVPRTYLPDFARDIPAVSAWVSEAQRMEATKSRMLSKYAEEVKELEELNYKDGPVVQKLADLENEATRANVDPSKPYDSGRGQTYRSEYPRLKEMWDALGTEPNGKEAQRLFERMRDAHKRLYDDMTDAIKIRIQELEDAQAAENESAEEEGRKARQISGLDATKIRELLEANKLPDPYFPLYRFGDYWVSAVKGAGKTAERIFSRFETSEEAREFIDALRKAAPGYDIKSGMIGTELNAGVSHIDPTFFQKVQDTLSKVADANERVLIQDQVHQLFLMSLPEASIRKHMLHRKGREGYSRDIVKGFAFTMFHGAHQLAKMYHVTAMQRNIAQMDQQIVAAGGLEKDSWLNPVAREVRSRHEWAMNPKTAAWANNLNRLGFAWYLGATPAAALVNLTQTAVMGAPVIAARKGVGMLRATKALLSASNDHLTIARKNMASRVKTKAIFLRDKYTYEELLKERLKNAKNVGERRRVQEELDFYQTMHVEGAFDKTQSHDVLGIAEAGDKYTGSGYAISEKLGAMFHSAEVWNREVTGMAAFRLARQDGLGVTESTAIAKKAVYQAHFDYTAANRPTLLQSDIGKVAFLFRQHALNMTYRLIRDSIDTLRSFKKDGQKEQYLEARRRLTGVVGMTAVFAGASGLPMFWAVGMLAGALLGEDDEKYDFETELRTYLAQTWGESLATAVVKGPVSAFTGADIASRVTLNGLWFREPLTDEDLEGKFYYYATEMAGANLKMLAAPFKGASQLMQGYDRGWEHFMPKTMKDSVRALRYLDEGLTNFRGDPLVPRENFGAPDLFYQVLGFTPEQVSTRYEQNRAIKRQEQHILNLRSTLLTRYWMALEGGDRTDIKKVQERIKKYNQSNRAYPLTSETLTNSVEQRQRYSRESFSGINLNKNLRYLARELRFVDER
jgi:hypothetical protein